MEQSNWKRDFSDIVQCSICIGTFKEPRMLPCLHSVCTECLAEDIKNRADYVHDVYVCPVCRKETSCRKGVENFPLNFPLNKAVEVYSRALQESDLGFLCSEHKKEIHYYCVKCDKGVCLTCFRKCTEHFQHVLDAEKVRPLVKQVAEDVGDLVKKTEENISQAEGCYEETRDVSQGNLEAIDNFADELICVIKTARDQYKNSVESKFVLQMSKIQRYREILVAGIGPVQTLLAQVDELLEKGELKNLLVAKKQLENFKEEEQDLERIESLTAKYTPEQSLVPIITALSKRLGELVLKEKVLEFSVARGGCRLGVTGVAIMTNGHILCVDALGLREFDKDGTPSFDFENVRSPFNCVRSVNEIGKESIFVSDQEGLIVNLTTDGVEQRLLPLSFRPIGLALTSKRQFVVSGDTADGTCVRVLSEGGEIVHSLHWNGIENDIFKAPWNVAVNSKDEIIVSDWKKNTIFLLDENAEFVKRYEPKTDEEKLSCPRGVATDIGDFIYVCDQCHNRVIMLTPDGEFLREVLTGADGLTAPISICLDPRGCLVIGEEDDTVKVFQVRV